MKSENKKRLRLWRPSSKMLAAQQASKNNLRSADDEFDKAFEIIDRYPKRVTMFGSARDIESEEPYIDAAYEIARKLAHDGYAIVSGGGAGIMGASNRGAYDAEGVSIGFNIKLPKEQYLNPYTTEHLTFHYFFTRKVMMTFFSHAYIYFPGGFGTLDELFELLTLIETKKMPPLRVVLYGSDFWNDLDGFIKSQLLARGLISHGDEKLYTITDSIDEAVWLVNSGFDN